MTSRQLSQIAVDLISEEDCARWLASGGRHILMFLMDGQWFEAVVKESGVALVDKRGECHPPNSKITAVKSAGQEDQTRFDPPVTHSVDVKHNLRLRGK